MYARIFFSPFFFIYSVVALHGWRDQFVGGPIKIEHQVNVASGVDGDVRMGNDIHLVLPLYWRGIECTRIHVTIQMHPRVAHVHFACSILEPEDWNEFEKKRGARGSTE